MIKNLFIVIYFILPLTLFSQVDVSFSVKKFNSTDKPYIENYLKIYANSFQFRKTETSQVEYQIQVTQLLKQDTTIVDYKKYTLKNKDTSNSIILDDLIDQQRFYVKNNTSYSIEIIIEDLLNKTSPPKIINESITINFPDFEIHFSDIEFIEEFSRAQVETSITKSGYNIIPLSEDFFGDDFEKIVYYCEIYNTLNVLDSNGKYLLVQYIENYDTKKNVGEFNKIKRYNSSIVQPIIKIWDIENLPTGNYNIVLQLKNKNNELLAEKKQRFQRLNLSKSIQLEDLNFQNHINSFAERIPADSLTEFIKCLSPIASELERSTIENQLPKLNEKMKREFIHQFWTKLNPNDPEKEWRSYQKKLNYAHLQFRTRALKGYETDRGRIYLKYGTPNSINDKPNSNNSYPYQVWHYYRAGKFNNKTCIFYSPNMIGNDYQLLHSDIPGENKDENWQRTLKKRTNGAMDEELRHQSWEQY